MARMLTPPTPIIPAKMTACLGDSLLSGSGRLFVLSINESLATSYTWFKVFAAAAHANVPNDVQAIFAQSMLSPLPVFAQGSAFSAFKNIAPYGDLSHPERA